mmetsp:Transcript_23406/g.35585  ORF Transcript_23406/g.35585 Transcript_23406/m.35585 type:complete len:124 (-) Transcript_23406:1398-1769(-)
MTNRPPCSDFTVKVLSCHREYGKLGEDCVREELEQKKCFAQLLCRKEARRFYNDKLVPLSNARWSFGGTGNDSKVSCSTIIEVFAKPENGMLMPESISLEDRKFCRKITHELARCLAKKRRQS